MHPFLESYRCLNCLSAMTKPSNDAFYCDCATSSAFRHYLPNKEAHYDQFIYDFHEPNCQIWITLDYQTHDELFEIYDFPGGKSMRQLVQLNYIPPWNKNSKEESIEYINKLITFS